MTRREATASADFRWRASKAPLRSGAEAERRMRGPLVTWAVQVLSRWEVARVRGPGWRKEQLSVLVSGCLFFGGWRWGGTYSL